MEKFAIHAEETTEAQRHLKIQQAGDEVRRKEDAHGGQVPRGPIAESIFGVFISKFQLLK